MPRNDLSAECQAFTRYLIGQQPSAYVIDKYVQAHAISPELKEALTPLDEFLLDAASSRPWLLRLVDPYTSAFARTAMVRKKLILLLSILETSFPSHQVFDSPNSGGRRGAAVAVFYQGVLSLTGLCAAVVLFPPLIWAYRLGRLAERMTGRVAARERIPDSPRGAQPNAAEMPTRSIHEVGVGAPRAERLR
jgi:hypothetical protein